MNLLRIPRTVQNIQRFRQIAAILVEYGFDELLLRAGIAERWYIRSWRRVPEQDMSIEERFVAMLERLGPSFIKLGQVLSTRADVLPQSWISALGRLQDTVSPIDFDILKPIIEAATGPIHETFTAFDETPLATASVGQVHAAVLPGDQQVVVKIVRPGMREQVAGDVELMRVFAQIAEQQIPELQSFRPTGVIDEFQRAITKEMDLRREAKNIERFRKNFATYDNVIVPEVWQDFSDTNVLVMQRIDGVKITACESVGSDPKVLAKLGTEVVLKMAFEDGFFHADPHPGNIWAMSDNRIALLDMGMADFVLPDTRDTMVDLLAAIATDDPDRLVLALTKLGDLPFDLDRKAFKRDVLTLYEDHVRDAKLSELDLSSLLTQSIDIGRKHRIVIPTDITMLLKGLGTIEGIGKQLYPDLDIVSEAGPHVLKLVGLRWGPERIAKQVLAAATQTYDLAMSLPERSDNLLQQVESGRFKTRTEIEGLEPYTLRLEATGNRIAVSILVLSLAVTAGSLWESPLFVVEGVPVLATLAGLAGLGLGLGLLFSSLRKRKWRT